MGGARKVQIDIGWCADRTSPQLRTGDLHFPSFGLRRSPPCRGRCNTRSSPRRRTVPGDHCAILTPPKRARRSHSSTLPSRPASWSPHALSPLPRTRVARYEQFIGRSVREPYAPLLCARGAVSGRPNGAGPKPPTPTAQPRPLVTAGASPPSLVGLPRFRYTSEPAAPRRRRCDDAAAVPVARRPHDSGRRHLARARGRYVWWWLRR